MKIKLNELRIGNWLGINLKLHPQNIFQITEIGQTMQVIESGLKEYYDLSNFDPIPLTPEVLEAVGFVNSQDVHWCIPNKDASKSFELCVWSDHVSYTMTNNFHLVIASLHQLQNLYYSLTGQELNYNPQ